VNLSFLVVGTPRSGTTLTQRLCCELPGVGMPAETHFLHLFTPRLLTRRRFPLTAAEVAEELDDFLGLPTSAHLDLDPQRVLDVLGGRCRTLVDLFAAVVAALCPPADVYGEKTPEHLLWWRVMAREIDDLKLVGVVRDPRAVTASHRAVPWGVRDPVELAEEWVFDQRQLRTALRRLGPARCLLTRYEDVVAAPDDTRARFAAFLGLRYGRQPAPDGIVQPWEWWKARALAPVTTDRVTDWRGRLSDTDVEVIERVAGPEMAAFGYLPARPPGRRCTSGGHLRPRLAARMRRIHEFATLVAPGVG
jgi:hypothetical protein